MADRMRLVREEDIVELVGECRTIVGARSMRFLNALKATEAALGVSDEEAVEALAQVIHEVNCPHRTGFCGGPPGSVNMRAAAAVLGADGG